MTTLDRKAAFHCADTGVPHQWAYLRGIDKNYRCSLCLLVITKSELKRLTDDA